MLHRRVNGYDMAYLEVGQGEPLVCVHGSLCDFRIWSPVLGPLSRRHSVIAVSLRHYFPEAWDGAGDDFTIEQHVDDVIGFLEMIGGKVDLLGHSRGGHIAFRIAQKRPDLLRRVVLAEPGGELDASLRSGNANPPPPGGEIVAAAKKIAAGDVDGGLEIFVDMIGGPGWWKRSPAATQQERRDNAYTLVGQVNERRRAFSRADAEGIRVPSLFIGGADTGGLLAMIVNALAAHVPGARLAIIPNTTHSMFVQDPVRFGEIVLDFLAGR